MLYNINTDKLALNLIPHFKRSIGWLVAYIKCVIKPIGTVNAEMVSFTDRISTYLKYTGQHMALVALLNDRYDATLRRITITEHNIGGLVSIDYYRFGELDPNPDTLYRTGEVSPSPVTMYRFGEGLGQSNFTVVFPVGLTFNESQVRALLDNYVECSRIYSIING